MIIGLHPSDAPPPDGNLIRRGLLALLRERAPDMPERLHHDPGPQGRPWAISGAFRAQGRWWTRVTALGAPTCDALGSSMRPGILPAARGWRVAVSSTWRARSARCQWLLVPPGATDAFCVVTLLTPIRFATADGGETAEPTAVGLLGCWARRWRAHLPAGTLPERVPVGNRELRQWLTAHSEIAGARIDRRTVSTSGGLMLEGTVGTVALRFTGSAETVAALGTIARLSTFAGTGRRLAHGFGQTAMTGRPCTWSELVRLHPAIR